MAFESRLLISFITRSHHFAPSLCSNHSPRMCLRPTASMPIGRHTALFFTCRTGCRDCTKKRQVTSSN
jgi:hypothetical protein